MEVIIKPSAESAVKLTAELIGDAVRMRPESVLGLATGRTMESLYAELSRMCREEKLDFSLTRTFNLDEYIGLSGDNINSYRYYMNYHLFNNINIDKRNTHLPDGMADDVIAEAARYEDEIEFAGGIDIQLLGIGSDGHIGFNEPLSSLSSRTRAKSLTPETYEQNSPLFDNPDEMPKRAFTMGVGTILDARRIIMLVTGAGKADILSKAVEGPLTAMITGSAIQLHPNAVVVCDEAAATKLVGRKYYDFVFQNEPEWEPYR
ncbi:MAG: glucosamine-6-phosphate deaminase [Lentisphaerae bacterium]|nr:glucosamine-6-phosphate deaminase [Victivallaceae bacterium]MDD5663691.1 glucosamine-6-phosphate deaminase [Victivallaceae bacterium]NLK83240.1 glucosamine-6-phosphate deaminase [Lentisphaerota bacterium]